MASAVTGRPTVTPGSTGGKDGGGNVSRSRPQKPVSRLRFLKDSGTSGAGS